MQMLAELPAWARRGLIAAALLTVLAVSTLIAPGGGLALRLDSSAAAVTAEPSGEQTELVALFQPGSLSAADILWLAELTERVGQHMGVKTAVSAATAQFPQNDPQTGDIQIASLAQRISEPPRADSGQPPPGIDALLASATREPGIRGQLLVPSADGTPPALALWMRLQRGDDPQADQRNAEALETLIRDAAQAHAWPVAITGELLVTDAVGDLLFRGLLRMIALVTVLVLACLWLVFASWRVLAVTAVTLLAALVWTLASMVLFNIPIHVVTVLVPSFVVTLGLAYALHMLSALARSTSMADAAERAYGLRLPMTITGLTTVVGLVALGWQAIPAVRQFAIASACGVVFSLLAIATLLVPLLLRHAESVALRPALLQALEALAERAGAFALNNRRPIVLAGLVVAALAGLAATQVKSGAHYVEDLPAGSAARADYMRVSQTLGGANSFDIRIQSEQPNGVLEPPVLAAVDDLTEWLAARDDVGRVVGPTQIIRRINQAFADGAPEADVLPASLAATRQLLLFGAPSQLNELLNRAGNVLTVRVYTPSDDTRAIGALLRQTRDQVARLPASVDAELSGNAVVLHSTVERLTSGQLRAFLFAFAGIYLVLAAVFASLRVGLRAMLPNVLPVLIYFGLIGLTGIELGPATALVACIVLGVAVDDTLMYLVRFNREAHASASETRAATIALRSVIVPATLTTVVVSLGLLSATSTGFASHAQFGALAAATLLVAWLTDLLLTPALAAGSTLVTLWDVLRINLGRDPQRSIPLFAGMSARQARVFALLAHRHSVPAGETFVRVGEPGTEMFLILDGEVMVWTETDEHDKPVEIIRLRRGASFGETGLFFESRTANVTATARTRLLAFSMEDLEQVRRRYPRIAALLLRNLNRAQAAVIARASKPAE